MHVGMLDSGANDNAEPFRFPEWAFLPAFGGTRCAMGALILW